MKLKKNNLTNYQAENYRSSVYSILKCCFGWNGCIPKTCNSDNWEKLITNSFNNNYNLERTAQIIANDIYENKGSFIERTDKKPNKMLPKKNT